MLYIIRSIATLHFILYIIFQITLLKKQGRVRPKVVKLLPTDDGQNNYRIDAHILFDFTVLKVRLLFPNF